MPNQSGKGGTNDQRRKAGEQGNKGEDKRGATPSNKSSGSGSGKSGSGESSGSGRGSDRKS